MSLRHCWDFIHFADIVRNRRLLAIHGSDAPFSHIVCENCCISHEIPAVSKLHLHLHPDSLSAPATPPHHQKPPRASAPSSAKRPQRSHSPPLREVYQHPNKENRPTPITARELRDHRAKQPPLSLSTAQGSVPTSQSRKSSHHPQSKGAPRPPRQTR